MVVSTSCLNDTCVLVLKTLGINTYYRHNIMSRSYICDSASLILLILLYQLLSSTAKGVVATENQSDKHRNVWTQNQAENNHTVPLDRLQKIFDPANCSDAETVCKNLYPTEVADYLEHGVNHSVKRLCLIIKRSFPYHGREINLHPITLLHSLTMLQVIPEERKLSKKNHVKIFFPNGTFKLPLKELHINIPIYQLMVEMIAPFLHMLDSLQVLNLANTLTINLYGILKDILIELKGKPLTALSLRSFQSLTHYHENFTEVLNVTDVLWSLRSCPLQYLDLSKNDFVEIMPGIYTVASGLRILDYSENNLISDGNRATLIELFFHPNLEILLISNQGYNDRVQSSTSRNMQLAQQIHSQIHLSNQQGSVFEDFNKCMHKLRLNSTEVRQKPYFCELLYCIDPIFLKGIPCKILPSWDDLFPLNFSCRLNVKFPVSKTLKIFNASNINILTFAQPATERNTLCFYPNSFTKITFGNNAKFFEGISFLEEMKYTHISGLEQVTHIDLSNNGLQVFPGK